MKSRRFKSILAVLLSISMIFGTSVFAMASQTVSDNEPYNGSTGGVGDMEGWVNKNVFKISIPVTSISNDNLAFVMDPQKLIINTGGIKYGWDSSKVEDTTLYFLSANKLNSDKYGNVSNPLSVNNLSSVSVDVSLTVKVEGTTGITLSDNSTYQTTDKVPKMYMGMHVKRGKNNAGTFAGTEVSGSPVALTAEDTVSKNMLKEIPGSMDPTEKTDKYSLSFDSVKKEYTYELDKNYVVGTINDTVLNFYFEGTCNPNADWKDLKTSKPNLDVVWNVRTHTDEPTEPTYNSTTHVLTIPASFYEASVLNTVAAKTGGKYYAWNIISPYVDVSTTATATIIDMSTLQTTWASAGGIDNVKFTDKNGKNYEF